MRLGEMLQLCQGADSEERFADLNITQISCDTREDQGGTLFVALPGFKFKGEDFIQEAIRKGAAAVAKSGAGRRIGDFEIPEAVAVVDCTDPKKFLRQAAKALFGNPSRNVQVIGVTGTNGKTTFTYL